MTRETGGDGGMDYQKKQEKEKLDPIPAVEVNNAIKAISNMTATAKKTPDSIPAIEVGKAIASLTKMGSDQKDEESKDKA